MADPKKNPLIGAFRAPVPGAPPDTPAPPEAGKKTPGLSPKANCQAQSKGGLPAPGPPAPPGPPPRPQGGKTRLPLEPPSLSTRRKDRRPPRPL